MKCLTLFQFLTFTKSQGNDLSTPRRSFPGLNPGDNWCLCALRWKQAFDSGKAPLVKLNSTHVKSLQFVGINILRRFDDSKVCLLPEH